MQKLILWDIDGTLLYSGGVAGEAMRASMERVYGRASTEARHSYAGKTDRQIILETFAERGYDELMGTLDRFTTTYIEELTGRREDFLARGRVLDGAAAALERLASAGVVQSVLTGNLEPIARIKLDMMGLTRFLDLDAGAYGSDHHRRVELAPIAAARAAAALRPVLRRRRRGGDRRYAQRHRLRASRRRSYDRGGHRPVLRRCAARPRRRRGAAQPGRHRSGAPKHLRQLISS